MGGVTSSVSYIGGIGCMTTSIGSISGGQVFSNGGNLIINGVPYLINGVPTERATKEKAEADKEDDKYKKTWDMDVPVFDTVQLTGAGTAAIDPKVLSKASFEFDLTGSGDIKITSLSKFDRVVIDLVGSGDIDLNDSDVKNASVNLIGSGDIKHFVITEEGTLRLVGSGDISCRKGPKAEISKRCYGTGDIKVR
jgi:hypothetical protein